MSAARVKSGWEIPPAAAKAFDVIADIGARLDNIDAETRRRTAAKEASDTMRGAATEE
jgi:hypothetical protein